MNVLKINFSRVLYVKLHKLNITIKYELLNINQ